MPRPSTLVTPLGPVSLSETEAGISALHWTEGHQSSPLIAEALAQLEAWFAGRLEVFDLALDFRPGLTGTVQRAMGQIPRGQTLTYGQIARQVGAPPQAVGQACGANPLPLIVPCHRVLGAKGLGGFSAPGGVEAKIWLLRHEGALMV
ncbi:methylated-DNA--[protein]-cysteine S-methyltransferase [Rhodobacter sp. KR11]|uniref:methylated-DNA--[protein]-cysteine S-methyltransferase n=1 Tax=Rhodobacter sp. KR11 TaxID=2974588 RepID=UPI002221E3D9|nr:methylated-DNA--[protein]-cysteine S-methyltransferase [Rhodobacter sp. KR11]MCW1918649.1 methylated-DNA--[protein]-cysteine S-methyltransferase [Rhodobacter sp. KR11]